ncbi:MAG: hypothetical protein QE280_00270 [Caulobacter sp.]|nr:hypothetical protein [Caulobacter sp.]
MRLTFGLPILMGALLVGGSAWAVDADCLWDHVPETQSQTWLQTYRSAPASPYQMALAEPLEASLARVCEIPPIQVPVIRPLLVARVLELGAGAYWSQRLGRAYAVETAWYGLTDEDRDRLRIWSVSAIGDGKGEELYSDAIPRLAAALGLARPDEQATAQVTAFVIGRAYREIISE